MTKVTHLPFDPGPAAWNELVRDKASFPRLEGSHTTDVLIIGAGFAGISAARQLKRVEPTLTVKVIEARHIGEGPAGRNSGFMIDLPHQLSSKDYSGEANRDKLQTQMNRAAIAFAREAIEDYDITRAAFAETGKINAAATQKGDRHNRDYASHLEAMGEAHEMLNAQQMHELCGSDYYVSGLYTPGTVLLLPGHYVHGFVKGLARDGVQLFENSPAINYEKSGNDWKVTTPYGEISAAKLILTTNGHLESFGHFSRQLMHIYLYASLTRPLTPEETKTVGEGDWGFTPSDPQGSTVRRVTVNGETRIVIRNGVTWNPSRKTVANRADDFASIHDRSFANRFPHLKNIEMDYRWGGLLCLSRNSVPAFGEIDENLYSACCQNGLGTAFGTLSGMGIADLVLDQKSAQTKFLLDHDQPQKLPPEPIASLGAKAVLKWGEWKAGREL